MCGTNTRSEGQLCQLMSCCVSNNRVYCVNEDFNNIHCITNLTTEKQQPPDPGISISPVTGPLVVLNESIQHH